MGFIPEYKLDSSLFSGDNAGKTVLKMFNEFLGTVLWFLLSRQADSPWAVGVTYVVISAGMGEGCHLFTPWTLYRTLTAGMGPIQGFLWISMQLLGAYVSGLLYTALKLTEKPVDAGTSEWEWAGGFYQFFGIIFILHAFWMANHDSLKESTSGMNKTFMIIFAFAVASWFGVKDGNLNFAQFFQDCSKIASCWFTVVWTLIAAIVMHFKMAMLE